MGQLAIVILHTSHVPLFCIVAGYLCHKQPVLQFYWKKIRRILIPFIVFSVLKLIYSTFISSEFSHGGTNLVDQIKFSFLIGTQYWFAYAILGIFALAPLFWIRGGYRVPRSLAALIISYVIVLLITLHGKNPLPNYFQLQEIVYYLPYFSLGCLLAQEKKIMIWCKGHSHILTMCSTIIILGFLVIYCYYPGIRVHPIRFFVAVSVAYVLYLCVRHIKKDIRVLRIVNRYSLQIMFLDGLYRVILFAIIGRMILINEVVASLIAIPTILISVVTCVIAEKIPVVRNMIGL